MTKPYDWICWEHSSAGYTGDGGCPDCDIIKARADRTLALEVENAKLLDRISGLEGTIDQLRNEIEGYRQ